MRKRCKRKVWALVNPVHHAMEGAALTHGPKLDKLRTVELSAIEAFRTGRATQAEWEQVAGLLNVCETMAGNGIGREALEACEAAQRHLTETRERYQKTGRMGLTGQGLQALRDLYEYHDLQRTSVNLSVYEQQIRLTVDRQRCSA